MQTLWTLEPHTAAKHAILRRYLGAWFPKLAWARRVSFIDGFAGPGEYIGGEPGSPQIALDVARNHTGQLDRCELNFHFVEVDRARYEHLDALVSSLELPSHIKFEAVHDTFSGYMTRILDDADRQGVSLAPCLAMVDPFGPKGLSLSLLKRIASHPRSELLVSLMYEPISRFKGEPGFEAHLDELYGTQEWRDAAQLPSAEERRGFLHGLYVRQLRDVAGMEYVLSFEFRDSGNRVEYFLIHATHSIEGLKAMKEAMWKVDDTGQFRFSDSTVGRQPMLFELGPDYDVLTESILRRFRGISDVPVEAIERFVLTETPFRETHYKRQVLKVLEDSDRVVVSGPESRRRGTFSAGTRITFRS